MLQALLQEYTVFLSGMTYNGIPELLYESMMKTDSDIRNVVCNIILSGDSTMFLGKSYHKRIFSAVYIKQTERFSHS